MRIQAASVASLALLALTGCALTNTATPSAESPVTGAAIQGVVHGGQQPVGNAHVYLFAAAETGQSDSVGPYILTTGGGNFTFPPTAALPEPRSTSTFSAAIPEQAPIPPWA